MEFPEQVNTNEKKAWFMNGYFYNKAIESKKAAGKYVSGSNEAFEISKIRTNDDTFLEFANKFREECIFKNEYNGLFSEMCNYYSIRENQISDEEAKFYFNWGITF